MSGACDARAEPEHVVVTALPAAPSPQSAPVAAAPSAAPPVGANLATGAGTHNAAPEPGALRFAGTELAQDALLAELAHAEPLSLKPVGSTSTVFRARLSGGGTAAFKTITRNRPRGPMSEVAAYRLARCLRLDNVPPAISRRIAAHELHTLLEPKYEPHWSEIRERLMIGEDGTVRVAALYWIPVLTDVGVDKQRGLRLASEWLRVGGTLPSDRHSLAASLSTLFAFDYLIANFDRWSGDNVSGDPQATFLYLRDHDQSFPLAVSEAQQRRLLHDLLRAERFSRGFYASLQHFTRDCLERELAQDPEGASLLNARQIADLLDRRQTLLSHIESLIALHGEAAVLFFP
jgi:hypothetical protein